MKKKLVVALVLGAIVCALAIPTFASAGRPPRGAVTVPDGVFGGTTTATANPGGDAWLHVVCYNDSGVAMEAYSTVDANNQATFQLGPTPSWSGGSAECIADEGYWGKNGFRSIANTSFYVAP